MSDAIDARRWRVAVREGYIDSLDVVEIDGYREEANQCDGCRRKLRVVNGTHRDEKDNPVMGCTKHLYL
jgi:hypothetical protein